MLLVRKRRAKNTKLVPVSQQRLRLILFGCFVWWCWVFLIGTESVAPSLLEFVQFSLQFLSIVPTDLTWPIPLGYLVFLAVDWSGASVPHTTPPNWTWLFWPQIGEDCQSSPYPYFVPDNSVLDSSGRRLVRIVDTFLPTPLTTIYRRKFRSETSDNMDS